MINHYWFTNYHLWNQKLVLSLANWFPDCCPSLTVVSHEMTSDINTVTLVDGGRQTVI